MPERVRTALTVAVHALVVLAVAALTARGVKVHPDVSGYFEAALLALTVGAYTALQHWLAGRAGGGWAKTARTVAAVMSLGLGALSPDPMPTVPPASSPADADPLEPVPIRGPYPGGQYTVSTAMIPPPATEPPPPPGAVLTPEEGS